MPALPDDCSSSPHLIGELMNQGYLAGPELDDGPELSDNQNAAESTLEGSSGASTAMDDAVWITDLGLSPVVLDYLLNRFRGMACYFPFVRLSETWTAASMADDHPFLLLAAFASSKFCHLQDALTKQFKEYLSKRVVMPGEKYLDLLQGLLVHLAWQVLTSYTFFWSQTAQCQIPIPLYFRKPARLLVRTNRNQHGN
jgi:hypothetical protein